jgi:hypothetical protein
VNVLCLFFRVFWLVGALLRINDSDPFDDSDPLITLHFEPN